MRSKIRHIAINVKDTAKVVAYYKNVFGMEETFRDSRGRCFPVWIHCLNCF
jgi:catechol 2,3-dioxygenase-like lactoylglutathione lyase family enzyme